MASKSLTLFEWFCDNYLEVNSGKSHVMSLTHKKLKIHIKSSLTSNEKIVMLLRATVDNKIFFEPHLVCKKVVQKLHAFDRVSKLISKKKLRVIMKAFMSLFCYCLLVWMCHSRTLNNKIYKLHKMTLRLVYDDRQSTFEELFNKDKSVTNHHRNLQVLVIEWYKVHHGLAAELDIFIKKIDTIQH